MKLLLKSLLTLAALALFIPVARAQSEPLQGSWEGVELGRESAGKCTLTVTADTMHFQGWNKGEWYKATFTLPATTEPRQLKAVVKDCPASEMIGLTALAIYKLEDGKLTVVGHRPGATEPPKGFAGDEESRTFVFTKAAK